MSFFVFYAPPRRRSRVHRGDCPDCNDGHGQEGQHRVTGGPTYWSDGYATQEAAYAAMIANDPNGRLCGNCLRFGRVEPNR
jgi:hypothetical protein